MTLVVTRLRVAHIQELQQTFRNRGALKRTFGCISSRLLLDRSDQQSAMVLMEFPSFAAAQEYCTTTVTFLPGRELAAMTILSTDFFEDAPLPEDAAAAPAVP
jgi:hypothetical protein